MTIDPNLAQRNSYLTNAVFATQLKVVGDDGMEKPADIEEYINQYAVSEGQGAEWVVINPLELQGGNETGALTDMDFRLNSKTKYITTDNRTRAYLTYNATSGELVVALGGVDWDLWYRNPANAALHPGKMHGKRPHSPAGLAMTRKGPIFRHCERQRRAAIQNHEGKTGDTIPFSCGKPVMSPLFACAPHRDGGNIRKGRSWTR